MGTVTSLTGPRKQHGLDFRKPFTFQVNDVSVRYTPHQHDSRFSESLNCCRFLLTCQDIAMTVEKTITRRQGEPAITSTLHFDSRTPLDTMSLSAFKDCFHIGQQLLQMLDLGYTPQAAIEKLDAHCISFPEQVSEAS